MSNLVKQNKNILSLFSPKTWFNNRLEGQAIETARPDGHSTDYEFGIGNMFNGVFSFFKEKIEDILKVHDGLDLTEAVSRQLELRTTNDPILSSCFEKILNIADTKFEIELELENKDLSGKALKLINTEIPKLFYFKNSLREVSRLILERLIRYGVFTAQKTYGENLELDKIVLIPAHTVKWIRQANEWRLIQKIGSNEITLNKDTFIYSPVNTIQNENGIYPIPPFKAALKPSAIYEMFLESLAQITRRTGMNKVLDVIYKVIPPSIAGNTDLALGYLKKGTPQEEIKKAQDKQNEMTNFASSMEKTMPNGFILHSEQIELKELATYEPSQNISMFNELLASLVITGAGSYASLVGNITKENQTTLSTVQKSMILVKAESFQGVCDSILKNIIESILIENGYIIKNLKIERETVQLDSELEREQAKKLKLENEVLERQAGNDTNTETTDELGAKKPKASKNKLDKNQLKLLEDPANQDN